MNKTNLQDIFELTFGPGIDAITELPWILRELAETIEEGHPRPVEPVTPAIVPNLNSSGGN